MAKLFPICGGQQSGKTTLCHHIVSELKVRGINAGYSQEAVRTSYLMFKGDRGRKMHLESLLIQLGNEILASEHYDVVICDRSAIDYLAYARLRFPDIDDPYLGTVSSIVASYSSIYSMVYITKKSVGADAGDPLRKGEDTDSAEVSQMIARIANEKQVPWQWIETVDFNSEHNSVLQNIFQQL